MSQFSFLLSLVIALLPFSYPASGEEANVPPDIARTLHQANADHDEAMRKRFEPIINDLSRDSDTGYAQLYSDAVRGVFFANDSENGSGWKQWQKDNKDILRDSRMPLATQASALFLQGHLYLILERKTEANTCFNKVLNILANGPQDLSGFHLMQESLMGALLFKYYNLSPEYFDSKEAYCGSIAQSEELFKKMILPYAIQNDPKNISSYWNTAIVAISHTTSLSDIQRKKFAVDDYPRLVLEEAKCLNELGMKKDAIYLLKDLLSAYPDSPRYKEISEALVAASSIPPVPSP